MWVYLSCFLNELVGGWTRACGEAGHTPKVLPCILPALGVSHLDGETERRQDLIRDVLHGIPTARHPADPQEILLSK